MNSRRGPGRYRSAFDGVNGHLNTNGTKWPEARAQARQLSEDVDEVVLRFEHVKLTPSGNGVEISPYVEALLNTKATVNNKVPSESTRQSAL